jgi:iron(III) transport system ATP-binding protein
MLQIDNLTKIFANTTDAVAGGIRDMSVTLDTGTFFTLLGPSGCGKTTTLRCVAGLETPDHGRVEAEGHVLFDSADGTNVSLNRREIGMVFQSYAIWPHMTVAENVAFPLTVAKDKNYSRTDIEEAVDQALRTVDLAGLQSRPATRLSGGQQQRVALARSIVKTPRLLLLDEPLSNLDAQLREEMRVELKRLQRQIGITTIYVTHDQAEALTLSDRIAVIDQGNVVQIGDPKEIYFRPATDFVARFVGTTNMLDGRVLSTDDANTVVELPQGHQLHCTRTAPLKNGDPVAVSIRPESIQLSTDASDSGTKTNRLSGAIQIVAFQGDACRVDVLIGDIMFQVKAPPHFVMPEAAAVDLVFGAENTLAVPKSSSQVA